MAKNLDFPDTVTRTLRSLIWQSTVYKILDIQGVHIPIILSIFVMEIISYNPDLHLELFKKQSNWVFSKTTTLI